MSTDRDGALVPYAHKDVLREADPRPDLMAVLDVETTTDVPRQVTLAQLRVYRSCAADLLSAAHAVQTRPLAHAYVLDKEYLGYNEVALAPEEVAVIRGYVERWPLVNPGANGWPYRTASVINRDLDIADDPEHPVVLMPIDQFRKVFLHWAYRERALVVGLNLAFDLSMLAMGVRVAHVPDTFKLVMKVNKKASRAGKALVSDRFLPELSIKGMGSKGQRIRFEKPNITFPEQRVGPRGGRDDAYVFPGYFLDASTLGWALTAETMGLKRAGKIYKVEHQKLDVDEHGTVTPEYLRYARHDVVTTFEVVTAELAELDRHPVSSEYAGRPPRPPVNSLWYAEQKEEPRFPGWRVWGREGLDGRGWTYDRTGALAPTEAWSSASIAKAYLREMGLTPPLARWPAFPYEVLGYAMSTFHGGRSEVNVRRTVLPIVYTDFLSMYPTTNALMGTWRLLTARRVEVKDATEDVRGLLERANLDGCFEPGFWQNLLAMAEVEPDGDILPVRAKYDGKARQIAVNPLHGEPRWVMLADLVASKLLSGRAPTVRRALRLRPIGRLRGMRPVRLGGADGVEVDPYSDDFFRFVIIQRKSLTEVVGLDDADRDRIGGFLKVLANSGSYGIFAEMNRLVLGKDKTRTVQVYGPGPMFEQETTAPEEPGRYSFPPLAAAITAAARLMLAMVERCVTDLGGTWLLCDTDSFAIVAREDGGLVPCLGGGHRLADGREAVRCLTWAQVETVRARFQGLTPYGTLKDELLELEKENYRLLGYDQGGRPTVHKTEREQLYGYAVSAKRYAMFNLRGDDVVLRKWSEHVLGQYLDPRDPVGDALDPERHAAADGRDGDAEAARTPLRAEPLEHKRWMAELWAYLIKRDGLGLNAPEPAWLDRPAVTQLKVSSPSVLDEGFKAYNRGTKVGAAEAKEEAELRATLKTAQVALREARRAIKAGHRVSARRLDTLAGDVNEARGRLAAMLDARLAAQPYELQIKPMDFLNAYQVFAPGINLPLVGANPNRFQLLAPFSRNPSDWTWGFNKYDGRRYGLTTSSRLVEEPERRLPVKSMRAIVADYLTHPEAKFLGPDGTPCRAGTRGLLARMPVLEVMRRLTGKEGNRLEERQAGLLHSEDEAVAVYVAPEETDWTRYVLPMVRRFGTERVAALAGLSSRAVRNMVNGSRPHDGSQDRVTLATGHLARQALDRQARAATTNDEPVRQPTGRLRFVAELPDQPGRRAPLPLPGAALLPQRLSEALLACAELVSSGTPATKAEPAA